MTSLHLMAYGGERGLPFTQPGSMSGPPGTALNITGTATELHARAVAEQLDCQDSNDQDILEELRSVSADRSTEVAVGYAVSNRPPVGLFSSIASVDGDIISDRQSDLYKS